MDMSTVGTFRYMAPERIQGQDYGLPCDVWSLGLSVLEIALGHYPYADDIVSMIDMMETIISEPLPQKPSAYAEEFGIFLDACLSKKSDERGKPDKLLESAWFKVHGITSRRRAKKKIARWLRDKDAGGGHAGGGTDASERFTKK